MRRPTRREVLAGAAAGLLGVGAFQAGSADRIQVERHHLRLPRWDADGFRLAVIGDIHVNTPRDMGRAQTAVRLAIAEHPDLVAIVGDFVNAFHDHTAGLVERSLEDLAGTPSVAIPGNHDYWVAHPEAWIRTLSRNQPFRMLRNETFEVGGVTVFGADDPLIGYDRYGELRLERASRSTLVLMHEPDYVRRVPRFASLLLGGHSHGGQICLPFGIPVALPPGARTYVAGFYPAAPVPVYVTRGVGLSRHPFRLFCPPEVSILTLSSA